MTRTGSKDMSPWTISSIHRAFLLKRQIEVIMLMLDGLYGQLLSAAECSFARQALSYPHACLESPPQTSSDFPRNIRFASSSISRKKRLTYPNEPPDTQLVRSNYILDSLQSAFYVLNTDSGRFFYAQQKSIYHDLNSIKDYKYQKVNSKWRTTLSPAA